MVSRTAQIPPARSRRIALSNHIPVAVWELCNEPYTLAGSGGLAAGDFFLNATDYVAQMKPFRDAIKAADSNAVVAIYFNDAGYAEPNTWDNDLKNYSDKYWDAVVYHHYPALPTSGVTFADLMALDNWQLASNTTARMTNYLIPDNNPGVTFLISEFASGARRRRRRAVSAHDDVVWRHLRGGISAAHVHPAANAVRWPISIAGRTPASTRPTTSIIPWPPPTTAVTPPTPPAGRSAFS